MLGDVWVLLVEVQRNTGDELASLDTRRTSAVEVEHELLIIVFPHYGKKGNRPFYV